MTDHDDADADYVRMSVYTHFGNRTVGDTNAPRGLSAPTAHAEGVPFDVLGEALDEMRNAVDMRMAEGVNVGTLYIYPETGEYEFTITEWARAGGGGGGDADE